MPVRTRRESWNNDLQYADVRDMALLIDKITPISGRYKPTLSNTTNVAASTTWDCMFFRVGDMCFVFGKIDVDTTAAGNTVLGISLPIPSNLVVAEDLAGTAATIASANDAAGIFGDITNKRATMQWNATSTANIGRYFSFAYRIL